MKLRISQYLASVDLPSFDAVIAITGDYEAAYAILDAYHCAGENRSSEVDDAVDRLFAQHSANWSTVL